ncbi:transglycosylase SLT domain-containing protein [Defluviimonas sp. SAOS-178_SWC]|uniref:transglycosylase SLT domain-containing protein n=1 Tax=Defluviimonas sp. SAOS-178_SWC TaxID=3121287 RepID=UPI0032218CAB
MFTRVSRPLALIAMLLPAACVDTAEPEMGRAAFLPAMRWDNRPEAEEWTAATLAALRVEGAVLASTVPADVEGFCPNYASATAPERRAFWAGLFSALAKHESTWNPHAKGGGGRWIGLMQIAPTTAQAYDCDLPAGAGLTDGGANLACAVKIAAAQVGRDGAIVSDGTGGWRGIARDWAPMRVAAKREDVAEWTSAQDYCQG